MASAREERLARNEAMFRVANERMAAWEESHADDAVELYSCECANPECREKVPLRRADYERVRADSRHFFAVPGHETPDVERVVEPHERWSVIEKAPAVGELVRSLDPRRDQSPPAA